MEPKYKVGTLLVSYLREQLFPKEISRFAIIKEIYKGDIRIEYLINYSRIYPIRVYEDEIDEHFRFATEEEILEYQLNKLGK